MGKDDRREFERYLQLLKVTYSILSGEGATPFEFGECVTLDISRKGVKLRIDRALPAPVLVQLYIKVPSRSYGIFILGKALYCKPDDTRANSTDWVAGIKFVGLLPPDLDKFITSMLGNEEWEDLD